LKTPDVCAEEATLVILLVPTDKSTSATLRSIKFFIVIPPPDVTNMPCEPDCSVNTPDPLEGIKFVPDDTVPMLIPAVLAFPIRAFVVRIILSADCGILNVPVAPPIPIELPLEGAIITFVALPVFKALPPICEAASKAIALDVKLIVPVESKSELAPVVNVPPDPAVAL